MAIYLTCFFFDKPIFKNLSPLASCLASAGAITFEQGQFFVVFWGRRLVLTGLVVTMTVNILVTGLIVFKIVEVVLEVKASTSVERTSRSLSSNLNSTGGTKLQHIIFILIESGMALFAIQVVRVVLQSLPGSSGVSINIATIIHKMLIVIIRSVYFYFFWFRSGRAHV